MDEAVAVKAFQINLSLSKVNAMKNKSETLRQDPAGHLISEVFDMSDLPLPVKKHIITAGIIQGDIFQYGDGFAKIKDVPSTEENPMSTRLSLEIQALSQKSFEMAVSVVEALMGDILEPQKINVKRLTANRSWRRVLKDEFEIQHLTRPVISHIITNGIIKGDIYQFCGAVVNTRGSPYMKGDKPLMGRPIYLLVQGPDKVAVNRAFDRINQLIKEAEEILSNEEPQIVSDGSKNSSNKAEHHQQSQAPAKAIDRQPQSVATQQKHFPPFMPQREQSVDGDITRCVTSVHWLLAHPLLVSFMACPPKNLNSNRFSSKLALAALLCLPLYDQYKCTHITSGTCQECHKFFREAQEQVLLCCQTVVSSGYDISKLMSVDDYVKEVSVDPEQIGVLYDYPLPVNLFRIDNCRLFIDLVITCGLDIEEPQIESYLKSTSLWYPVAAFEKIVLHSKIKHRCPSKNPKSHHYPTYRSLEHHGGLINFLLQTMGNAAPGQLCLADAEKIPKCKYFPFLHKLSVFSKLYNINKNKKYVNVAVKQVPGVSGSISQAAFNIKRESLSMLSPNSPLPTAYGAAEGRQCQPNVMPGESMPSPQTPYLSSQPSTSTCQSSLNNPFGGDQYLRENSQYPTGYHPAGNLTTPESDVKKLQTGESTSKPGRILRKEIRKLKAEDKLELERKLREDQLKEQYGLSEFSKFEEEAAKEKMANLSGIQENLPSGSMQAQADAMQISTGSLFSQNLQQVLSNMQRSMQTNLFETPATLISQESKPMFELPLFSAGQMFAEQPKQDDSKMHGDSSQDNPFSEVISKLQEYIHDASTKTEESSATPQQPLQQSTPTDEDSPFTAVIQQLQQYIHSNTESTSQDGLGTRKQSEPCLQKRESTEATCEPQPKRLCTEQNTNIFYSRNLLCVDPPGWWRKPDYTLRNASPQQKPAPREQKPMTAQETPTPAQQKPAPAQQKPAPAQQKPAPAQQKPMPAQQKTAPAQQKPAPAQQKPAPAQQKPAPAQQKPAPAQQKPAPAQQKPVPAQQKPATAQQKPATAQQKPATAQQKPATAQQKPATAQQKPAAAQQKTAPAQKKLESAQLKPESAQLKPESAQLNPGKAVAISQKPSTSIQQNPTSRPNFFSKVSILGDGLLLRAREVWGGSNDRDLINDTYDLFFLQKDLVRYCNCGGKLNRYCVLMCGVNYIINDISEQYYIKSLKSLLNYLSVKGCHVFAVTLPRFSANPLMNKMLKTINGFICSFNQRPNITIIQFYKTLCTMSQQNQANQMLIRQGNTFFQVLSKTDQSDSIILTRAALELLSDLIEQEVVNK